MRLNLSREEEAIKCFDEVHKISQGLGPKNASDWNNEGYDLFDQDKYDEAIKVYDEAIKLASKINGPVTAKAMPYMRRAIIQMQSNARYRCPARS